MLSGQRARRGLVFLAALFALFSAAASGAAARTLYVSSKTGRTTAACTSIRPCKTVGRAIAKARAGDAIVVVGGTYREQVTIAKRLSLIGERFPQIDAGSRTNGILITGPGAAGSLVRGFVVKNATFEGILALSTSRVTIADNTVANNDQGVKSKSPTGECAPAGQVPGDCGEGLHLMGVTKSKVLNNTVTTNAGGILLTDETGPTSGNTISGNTVTNNVLDCGITVAGHNAHAFANGKTVPNVGGIYNNTIASNVANGNGTKGQGAGILLAVGAPGSAVYDNTVKNNTASGNGLAGVTLHSHAPGQDLNGNKITGNTLSNNGLTGDSDFNEKGTVDLLVASAVVPLQGTVISGNTLRNAHFGIWTKSVPPINLSANTFKNVTVKVFQS